MTLPLGPLIFSSGVVTYIIGIWTTIPMNATPGSLSIGDLMLPNENRDELTKNVVRGHTD